ncbi:MAG: DNA-protecting protein DprA, partial [Actinomycetota bacterium]|nr:DNA-protecting protein DprA [Actinomycetota bacterium]
YFPAVNRELQRSIAANGLVLSQFWPNAPPTRQTFPMRNATMSAYGRATIIVEAGEHSGARSQARSAIAHGRPVILMTSVAQGTN